MHTKKQAPRGMALVMVLGVAVVMSVMIAFALTNSFRDARETGKLTHNASTRDAAEATLQYARAFFASNYGNWNTYLALTYPPDVNAHPELYPASPAGYTCYIYAKDDNDELPPAVNNPAVDNNLRIFVGGVCTQAATGNVSELSAALEFNPLSGSYTAQSSGGTQGLNNYSTVAGYRP